MISISCGKVNLDQEQMAFLRGTLFWGFFFSVTFLSCCATRSVEKRFLYWV